MRKSKGKKMTQVKPPGQLAMPDIKNGRQSLSNFFKTEIRDGMNLKRKTIVELKPESSSENLAPSSGKSLSFLNTLNNFTNNNRRASIKIRNTSKDPFKQKEGEKSGTKEHLADIKTPQPESNPLDSSASVSKPVLNYSRKKTFKVVYSDSWYDKEGLPPQQFSLQIINNIEFQSNILIDEMKVLMDNIQFYKLNFLTRKQVIPINH